MENYFFKDHQLELLGDRNIPAVASTTSDSHCFWALPVDMSNSSEKEQTEFACCPVALSRNVAAPARLQNRA